MRRQFLPESAAQNSLPSDLKSIATETAPEFRATTTPYLIEPELLGQRPRPVYWNQSTVIGRLWLWNLTIGALLLMLFCARTDLANWTDLIQHGVVSQGKIIRKQLPRDRDSRPTIQYTVPTDAGVRTRRDHIAWDAIDSYNVGQTIPITYLPGHNGKIWRRDLVTPERRDLSVRRWTVFGSVLFFLCGVLVFSIEMYWRRQKRLLQSGEIAVGRILSGYVRSDDGSKSYFLKYRFTTEQQETISGVLPASHRQFVNSIRTNPSFSILYDPRNPKDHIPYSKLTDVRLPG